jgi:hypothetical protein
MNGGVTPGFFESEGRAMPLWKAYFDDIIFSFRKHKQMTEQAVRQVDDKAFFHKPAEFSNSIAAVMKHVAGNLASRWTDFLTTDGEKPTRDRDAEFIIGPDDTRPKVLAAWEAGWAALFGSLEGLGEADLPKKITIRGEEHSVFQAIHRSLTHTAYHVGQIVYLARMLKTDGWEWLTIPPGQSRQYGARGSGYLK